MAEVVRPARVELRIEFVVLKENKQNNQEDINYEGKN
jgi:hypothetical protein